MSTEDSSTRAAAPSLPTELAIVAFFLAAIAFMLFFRLGEAPPKVNAEIRCWKVVSEMTRSGDLLIPRRDGKPHLNKPPLFYWTATLASHALGGASYATLRLPSAVAALLLFLLTYAWARSIGGPTMALAAAGSLSLMWFFYKFGRLGIYEMQLATLTNAALVSFDAFHRLGRKHHLPLIFLFALCGFLTKGPPAYLIVGVPTLLFLAVRKELRKALCLPVILLAIATVALGLAWFVIVTLKIPGAADRFLSQALLPVGVVTADHTALHYRGPFYYFPRIFKLASPISVLLPLVILRAWRTNLWCHDDRLRFCGLIFLGLFVAFSIFLQKREYYLLPVMPALAILTADSILWAVGARPSVRWAWIGLPAVAIATAALALSVPIFFYLHVILRVPLGRVVALCVAEASLGALALWSSATSRWKTAAASILLAFWLSLPVYLHSYSIWRAQFYMGVVDRRPDYDEAHWAKLKKRYPLVEQTFRIKEEYAAGKREQ